MPEEKKKYPGVPLTAEELEALAPITPADTLKAIKEAEQKLKEYLEAGRGNPVR
jgi:hypothetical protein